LGGGTVGKRGDCSHFLQNKGKVPFITCLKAQTKPAVSKQRKGVGVRGKKKLPGRERKRGIHDTGLGGGGDRPPDSSPSEGGNGTQGSIVRRKRTQGDARRLCRSVAEGPRELLLKKYSEVGQRHLKKTIPKRHALLVPEEKKKGRGVQWKDYRSRPRKKSRLSSGCVEVKKKTSIGPAPTS